MKLFGLLVIFLGARSSFCSRGGRTFGPKDGKIVGGMTVRIEEVPYQVSLRYFGSHICGGAIIRNDFIITAAHCTFGKQAHQLSVLVGATVNFEGGDLHDVAAIKQHPYFNYLTFDFDASLLQLVKPIKIDDYRKQEITLPAYGERLPEKTPVLVSGWGETRNDDEDNTDLRAVILFISNQSQCNKKYISDGGVTARMVCAFALNKDSCAGDSGGPMRRLSDGKLVGLVSFGPGDECANAEYPGVYTKIATIRPWIRSITKI